ncbi:MAG: hypothetical protein JEY94_12185 [Melioribacteraceae bacterium]|nr:hypothetical protein [Melioribacteraceae bacterium]
MDIFFPSVDPYADRDYIDKLAEDYLQTCLNKLQLTKDVHNAVHLMGEHTFVFSLTNKLKKNNIKVISSTSNRNALITEEGKFVQFNFVRFREY